MSHHCHSLQRKTGLWQHLVYCFSYHCPTCSNNFGQSEEFQESLHEHSSCSGHSSLTSQIWAKRNQIICISMCACACVQVCYIILLVHRILLLCFWQYKYKCKYKYWLEYCGFWIESVMAEICCIVHKCKSGQTHGTPCFCRIFHRYRLQEFLIV